jgi:hypothetical protein
MRVPSKQRSIANDGTCGYLHDSAPSKIEFIETRKRKRLNGKQVTEIATRCFYDHRAAAIRVWLSEQLNVSVVSLLALRVGYGIDYDGREYSSWPSRNFKYDIIGITRRYSNGEKKTLHGTRNGVFVPIGYEGELNEWPTLIVEGGSDVCAAFDIGRLAIGRPSSTGGAPILKAMLRHHREVLVVGENDCAESKRGLYCPADCTGCSYCFPGKFGAVQISKKLHCRYWMPPAGIKDFREYVKTKGEKNVTTRTAW